MVKNNLDKTQIALELERLRPLLNRDGNLFEIFHSYFQEFVCEKITNLGIKKDYNLALGEVYYEKEGFVSAAYHFLKSGDRRANDLLIPGAHQAFIWGEWEIAIDFLLKEIDNAKSGNDPWKEGYASYHISQIYRERGEIQKAKEYTQTAIQLFKQSDEKIWVGIAECQQYLDFISEGKIEEGISGLEGILNQLQELDDTRKVQILVNLSYAYIQISQYEKAAEYAKTAYEMCVNLRDFNGLTSSLLNLTASLGSMGEYEYTEKYAKDLIIIAKKYGYPRLEAGGLNNLSKVQRITGRYKDAKVSLERAIALSRELGAKRSEIMNTLNLGNVFKDIKKMNRAAKLYNDGLAEAKEYNYQQEEGRAYELMAGIERIKKRLPLAIKYASLAIDVQKKINDFFRLAESYFERALSYSSLKQTKEAAEDFEFAGYYYEKAQHYSEAAKAYKQAISLLNAFQEQEKILNVWKRLAMCIFQSKEITQLSTFIRDLESHKNNVALSDIFVEMFSLFLSSGLNTNIASLMYTYSSYLKILVNRQEKSKFYKVIKMLAERAKGNNIVFNLLLVGIEQGDERLLSKEEYNELIEILVSNLDGFYFRRAHDDTEVWTVNWKIDKLYTIQVQCLSDRLIEKRLSLSLALVLYAYQDTFVKRIKAISEFKEEALDLIIVSQKDFENNIAKDKTWMDHLTKETPVIFTGSNVPKGEKQPPTMIIVHDEYENFTDWSINPGNKAIIWLIMNLYRIIIQHFTDGSQEREVARKGREFCEYLFGMRKDVSEKKPKDYWKVTDIKEVLKTLKR